LKRRTAQALAAVYEFLDKVKGAVDAVEARELRNCVPTSRS
jgi:hypothetical protein